MRTPGGAPPANPGADQPRAGGQEPDASDVVEGPVGSASLKDPAIGRMGADLNELQPIDASDSDEDPSGRTPPPG